MPRRFSRADLHVGSVFREDVQGLIRSLPTHKADIVRRLLWIVDHARITWSRECKCGARLSRDATRCISCHLAQRKAAQAPRTCAACGGPTSTGRTIHCRACSDKLRQAKRCACGTKLPKKNKSGKCGNCYKEASCAST